MDKSNKSISVDANIYLELNIYYGFSSPITITTPSTNQTLAYDGSKWAN